MRERLHVLVVESSRGDAEYAAEDLERAGHHVYRCRGTDDSAFPCVAVNEAMACPFESQPIDVALTVRSRPRSQPTTLEDGVSCALRRQVPLVVAGRTALNPFEAHATEVVGNDEIVGAVERAAGASPPRLVAAAQQALRSVLDARGLPSDGGSVTVRRRDGGLDATITLPEDLGTRARGMASVRVAGALRRADPFAARIDVSVAPASRS